MKGILGKKLGMTQIFDEKGVSVPVTAILAGPCPVLQKKTPEKDAYAAVQLGFGAKRVKSTTKPLMGHFKKSNTEPKSFLKEIRVSPEELANYEVGTELKCDIFKVGDIVNVVGWQKGRGFQGVMRRHNFAGAKASHGAHEVQRHPGAIGQHSFPARIWKGKKMPGQMGGNQCTIRNLTIVKVLPEENILLVKGGVPGARNDYLVILNKKG